MICGQASIAVVLHTQRRDRPWIPTRSWQTRGLYRVWATKAHFCSTQPEESMSDPQVTVYSDSSYQGTSRSLGVGGYDGNFGIKNDALSSVKVPSSLKVYLYKDSGYEGQVCILVRDTPNLGSVNDQISSIQVIQVDKPRVILYSDSQYRGWSQELGPGSYASLCIGNDALSSMIIPSGYRVTIYQDSGFKGPSLVLTQDAPDLKGWNDKASSIIVDRIDTAQAPTLAELQQIIDRIGPRFYFHPDDEFGPSSVEWFLQYATLHNKADGSSVSTANTPLPTGGQDDHAYWLDISSRYRGGNLGTATAYVNAKYANSWLDIQFWFFYPYNGAGSAKISVTGYGDTLHLNPAGEHGGDWEHVTCRIDPNSKALRAMYLAQHNGGTWVSLGDIPMEDGRPVVFSSRHGHASYRSEGDNLSNSTTLSELGVTWFRFGLVNAAKKGTKTLECHSKYQILRADFLGDQISAPAWTQYNRRWGPQLHYSTSDYKDAIRHSLGNIPYADKVVDAIWDAIPDEAKEEDGPTGPWMKSNWKSLE